MGSIPFYKLIFGSVTFLIGIYVKKYEELDKEKYFLDNPPNFLLPQTKEYDFIVVGGGSAGSIVANRLSKEFSVLLLESGGDPIPQTYIPANSGYMSSISSCLHEWTSIQQVYSTLGDDGLAKLRQGKFLGGSSVVNGLVYNRGHPNDYNHWANLTGDDSWNYTNLIKYFHMTEDFYEAENLDGHLGVGGPLSIRKGGKELKSIYNAFLNGGKEIGYNSFNNSNAPQTEGFGPISETIRFGRRVSSYEAFLKPILDRRTITILRYSHVSHVDIDKKGQAIGVYFIRHGIQMYAKARNEIILSAGSMNTPIILLRSGIGPSKQLMAAGIEIKADLPVGQNFQDHPWSGVSANFDDPSKLPLINFSQIDVDDFLYKGKGPLTLPWGVFGQAFIVSSFAKYEGTPEWPDIEFIILHNASLYIPEGDNTIFILCMLGRVSSRGSVSLDTTNLKNPSIWDPRWLENKRDLKVLAEAVKLSAKLLESNAFKKIGVSLDKTITTGCEDNQYGSDKYWRCHVRQFTRTTWHPTGTCKMGKINDSTSVVDTKLQVKKIKGLRVIDNSIQPEIINANTNAAALMIGQKGASMILKKYGRGSITS